MKHALSALVLLGLLCSCVGVRTEINLNADGTGTMTLEYRVSRQMEAIGALDGNASRPGVPVGRIDLERTIERLEGLRMVSFSSKEEDRDLVTRAVISFSRLEDILPLLDSGGGMAELLRDGDRRTLHMRLGAGESGNSVGGGSPGQDPDPRLLALAEQIGEGYRIAISLSAPSNVELRVTGNREDVIIENAGRKAGVSAAMSRFFRPEMVLELDFIF